VSASASQDPSSSATSFVRSFCCPCPASFVCSCVLSVSNPSAGAPRPLSHLQTSSGPPANRVSELRPVHSVSRESRLQAGPTFTTMCDVPMANRRRIGLRLRAKVGGEPMIRATNTPVWGGVGLSLSFLSLIISPYCTSLIRLDSLAITSFFFPTKMPSLPLLLNQPLSPSCRYSLYPRR
jgi:hypothetical protein